MFNIFAVIKEIRKFFDRKTIMILVAVLSLFFLIRLTNLTNLPIFSDEGIYIEWSKIAWKDASQRFVSLTDGRQPLQTWLTIPFLKIFSYDPLFAGRLFAVLGGLFSFSGIFALTTYIFNKRIGYIAITLYTFVPMFVFYDRINLVDTWVGGFAVWTMLFSLLLVKYMHLDIALIFGILLGIGMLAKSTVQLFIVLSAMAIIVIIYKNNLSKKEKLIATINYYCLLLISSIIALSIYSIQRLTPYFHIIGQKNHTFIISFEEFIKNPFHLFFNNLILIPSYIGSETGWFFMILATAGLGLFMKENKNYGRYFGLWIIIPVLLISFFNQVLFPRYILFVAVLLIIPASYILDYFLVKTKYGLLLTVIGIISILYPLYTIVFDAKHIKLPDIDGMYVNGTTSGYGMQDVIDFARRESKNHKVIILAEGNFGLAADSLKALMVPSDTFEVHGYWPLNLEKLKEYQSRLKDYKIFAVYAQKTEFSTDYPLKKIAEYTKPENKSIMYLFELLP